jgi:serine/threonine-protein kinase
MAESPAQRWSELEGIIDQALDLAPDLRSSFLTERCSGDPSLKAEAEQLLRATEAANFFLDQPGPAYAAPLVDRVNEGLPLAPGTTLGAYEVVRRLGRGGTATVYLARDAKHHRSVAIKVLHPWLATSLGSERFLREIELAATLQHPHVIPLFDSGTADGLLYYVMPHVQGESLRQRLAHDKRLPMVDAIRIAQEVAGALDYAHRQGVMHRDIKPENILLQDGQAIVADFGVARAIEAAAGGDGRTETGPGPGTPAYMSPEQASSATLIDGRADIYALGCVLYEMLGGRPPFMGTSPEEILGRHTSQPVPPLRALRSTVPSILEEVATKALAKAPADRFPTAGAFLRALDDAMAETAGPRPRRRGRRVMVAVALGLAVIGGALWQRYHGTAGAALDRATEGSKRLAVLPFENLGDSADGYFADGVTDAVRDKLASVPGLEVIATSSAGQYRHTATQPKKIGRELGVRYLLLGKVRWEKLAGGVSRIQVRSQLIEAATGVERWAETFEAPLNDVFKIQADVGSRVAQALGVALSPRGRERLVDRPTSSLAAYDLYLQGRVFWNQRTPSALRTAARYFERAIREDSSYAQAHAALAAAYELYPDYGIAPPSEARPKAKAAALQALALDSTLGDAHAVLADARYSYDWDWQGAELEFRRAITLDPGNATAHHWYADYLSVVGRLGEALTETERAHALDPLSRSISADKGMILYRGRRYDEAVRQFRQTLELDPDFAVAHDMLGSVYLAQGRPADAVAELETAVRLTNSSSYMADLLSAYAASGQWDRARALVRELLGRSHREYIPPAVFAVAYTGLGNRTRAFAYLDSVVDNRDIPGAAYDPFFDSLRSDPRFTQLLRRVGLE